MSVMLPDPPRVASILAVSGSSLAAWTMSWAMAPKDSPAIAAPMVQPSRAPRWSRHARASGLPSQGGAVAGPSRVPSAHVAPDQQRRSRDEQDPQQRHRQQQDPPALAGERLEPLGPADGRQPRQPRQLAGGVADRAEQEGHA